MIIGRYKRELAPLLAFALLLSVVGAIAPAFFSSNNLRDLAIDNAPVLIVAIGMTLVILVGEIDISVGSQFAVCSVVLALLAKIGVPIVVLPLVSLGLGAVFGAINGLLIGVLGLPSIIVTLAMMVAWRDGLRWTTDGAWVMGLPANFQWFGLSATSATWLIVGLSLLLLLAAAVALRQLSAGRALYAVGSNAEAARLAGIDPVRVRLSVFVTMGALTGLAALLNSVRFDAVPASAGVGLELKAIAAVVVGGAAITGGRANLVGTLIGVALLGSIGTALSFIGVNPFWEKAIQGAIILAALGSDALLDRIASMRPTSAVAGKGNAR